MRTAVAVCATRYLRAHAAVQLSSASVAAGKLALQPVAVSRHSGVAAAPPARNTPLSVGCGSPPIKTPERQPQRAWLELVTAKRSCSVPTEKLPAQQEVPAATPVGAPVEDVEEIEVFYDLENITLDDKSIPQFLPWLRLTLRGCGVPENTKLCLRLYATDGASAGIERKMEQLKEHARKASGNNRTPYGSLLQRNIVA